MERRRKLFAVSVGIVAFALLAGTGLAAAPVDADRELAVDRAAVEAPAAGQADDDDGSSLPPALDGAVTTPPAHVGDRIVVGTDRGLYVFSDGRLEHYLETPPVRTIEPAGEDTVTVLHEDASFQNVRQVDLTTGETAWAAGHSREVYSPDFGTVERRTQPFDAVALGDGGSGVAVSTGQSVVAYDGSGDRQWTVDHGATVWALDRAGGTVYAGTQDGALLAIDADDGSLEYETQITTPFEIEDEGEMERSVWSVEHVTVGGADRIAVTSDDGYARLLDPADGSVVWETRVREYDEAVLEEYYGRMLRRGHPTVPGDATFFDLELTVVDRDQGADLAVAVTTEEYPLRARLPDSSRSLHLLEGASGDVQWSNRDVRLSDSGNVAYADGDEGPSLLVPHAPDGPFLPVTVVDTETGETETRRVGAVPTQDRSAHATGAGFVGVDDGDGQLAVTSTAADLTVVDAAGDLEWTYPALQDTDAVSADFTGDGVTDHLVVSRDAMDRFGGPPQTRGLVRRDGTDGTIAWSRFADPEAFARRGGYSHLQVVEGPDGGADLLALRQGSRERGEIAQPSVVVLDGANGSQLRGTNRPEDAPLIRFLSLDVIGDVNGNGEQDLLIAQEGAVSVVDPAVDGPIWVRSYRDRGPDIPQWRPLEGDRIAYEPIGGDGPVEDVLAVSQQGQVAVLEADTSGEELSFETVRTVPLGGEIRIHRTRPLGDVNGDGYEEVLLTIVGEDGPKLVLFAPGQDEAIRRIGSPREWSVRSFEGEAATVAVAAATGDGPQVSAFVPDAGRFRHEFDARPNLGRVGIRRTMPAAPAGDVDGDGTDEIAVVEASDEGGAAVDIYDVGSGDVVDSIELERVEEGRTIPGVYAEPIPDRTGDDHPELGVVAAVGGGDGTDLSYYVVDPREGAVLVGGDGVANRFLALADGVGVLGPRGSLATIDVTRGVSLSQSVDGADVALDWEVDDEYVSRVYVDGRPVALTRETSATVRLPPGEHTVQVRATGPDGVTVYDTVEVEVTADSSLDLLLYGATAGALGLLFVPYGIRRFRRR